MTQKKEPSLGVLQPFLHCQNGLAWLRKESGLRWNPVVSRGSPTMPTIRHLHHPPEATTFSFIPLHLSEPMLLHCLPYHIQFIIFILFFLSLYSSLLYLFIWPQLVPEYNWLIELWGYNQRVWPLSRSIIHLIIHHFLIDDCGRSTKLQGDDQDIDSLKNSWCKNNNLKKK